MKACTKCGRRHDDAEAAAGRRLYCSDVKAFWASVRKLHKEETGCSAVAGLGKDGKWVCLRCGLALPVTGEAARGLAGPDGSRQPGAGNEEDTL